jgi:hypothetical protein
MKALCARNPRSGLVSASYHGMAGAAFLGACAGPCPRASKALTTGEPMEIPWGYGRVGVISMLPFSAQL